MSDADEVWLVAGGEPGAKRFGQLVQRLRKEKRVSVEDVAAQAELSVGTIRAIEQGRRAPSEESGIRLLQLLLPGGVLTHENGPGSDGGSLRLNCAFTDPETGSRIVLEFKAKTAGDNRRWSSDKPRVAESRTEAAIRELMSDPGWQQRFRDGVLPTLAKLGPAIADLQERAAHPGSDADLGRVTRRFVMANEFRLQRLENLLDLWDRVDSDGADTFEHDLASKVNRLLDGYQRFPGEDGPTSDE